ncbi:hypothetical protein ACFSQD_16470 [Flavihumibacter stibioxidans]|uniref:DUF4468 domain-containing protein n=1 Tax=Flavihumibacter stibioxidans TaxID=1834163 RepID=A0ABR7M709_9BACT|nr:hypothetical protein [Flavihumibacter stibioxidans]MBC6490797.1 hypothetical protein [Flavihumibacter stibioxidans]
MKKTLFVLAWMICAVTAHSQTAADSAALVQRLDEFMKANSVLDIPKVIDYTYPKLFELAPKETIIEAMKNSFDNEEIKITMDSLAVVKIHPVFALNNGMYSRIDYSMVMRMQFKKQLNMDQEQVNSALTAFRTQFGQKNVWYNETDKLFNIYQLTSMAALRDEPKEKWTFVNIKKDDPMMMQLLDKALIEKLESYK